MRRLAAWLGSLAPSTRSIRARLTLWYVGLLGLIVVAFSLLIYVNLERGLRAELDRSLTVEAEQTSASLDLRFGVPLFLDSSIVPPPGMVIALYDATGQRVVANDARQSLPVLLEALSQAAQGRKTFSSVPLEGGGRWRILTVPLTQGGRLVGVMQAARSERDVELALQQLLTLLTIAIPLTLLVASVGGLFLARRALGPIDRMRQTAERISEQDLSQRIATPVADDEVGRLGETFNHMLERVERAFQRQRQFTADASHELRTPLAVMSSEIELALSRPRDAAEYRGALERLQTDAQRLTNLLGAMLTLSRSEAGQERFTLEPLRLDLLVADVVESLRSLAESEGVELAAPVLTELAIMGDQTRVTQLVVNLVENGLKYTPAGGGVAVSISKDEAWAVLTVTDNGPGIAPEHLPRLFDRFYRVDRSRAREEGGAGLGLAICQWIARGHGGELSVESELGRGTTFTARLPLSPSAG